ncbi:glycosyltransferase family 9 protein, partial [Erwinia sp.]|uniref:glycosyltransferase family 9 protein n=1 Tax=Erwinia citreus TaxID=558 RepID=UPI003C7839A2
DRPNITLYGPTDPGLIGGYGKNQCVLRPEQGNNMASITADKVMSLLMPLLVLPVSVSE